MGVLVGVVQEFAIKNNLSFLDPQEAIQWQHVRGQVCCISEGVCGVSSPKLPNTPSLWQKQRPGATSKTPHSHSVILIKIHPLSYRGNIPIYTIPVSLTCCSQSKQRKCIRLYKAIKKLVPIPILQFDWGDTSLLCHIFLIYLNRTQLL